MLGWRIRNGEWKILGINFIMTVNLALEHHKSHSCLFGI